MSFYSTQLQKVVIIHSGGHDDDSTLNFRPNEVWGSSDQGVTWTLFPRAPYLGRNHASMQVASNGVMVVVGGKTDVVTVTGNGTNSQHGLQTTSGCRSRAAPAGRCVRAWPASARARTSRSHSTARVTCTYPAV